MITKITGEQPFQVLTNNFSISPSQEGYTLQISADGKQYSNLFTVGAGVTRLVTGVAANSYYRLSGNQSEVSINWMKVCVTDGGGSGTELSPIDYFPLNAEAGTVVAYSGSSSAAGIYQFNGTDWVAAGGSVDLDEYWTSAETKTYVDSAFTIAEDHITDVERVTASAYTEMHDDILELSGRTVDLSGYYTSAQTDTKISQVIADYTPTSGFSTINGSAITNGGNIVISADLTNYWTSAQTKTYVDSAITIVQNQIDTMDEVVSQALVDLNGTKVASADVKHIVKLTQIEYEALTVKDPYTFYIIISNS